ncbi:hypothetical protein LWI28_000835 [Acer negundo]|uniref:Protodermal factor 1 n=1 Tax=Acer negundo TaxID=4023 RepID=A0AAD5NQE7_ACENE|nr:hypothetical protein LWI28_000835 [Acer negundo]KAK4847157.1 hypothetical protein QYF36_026350 [Acer negundo]
MQTSVLKCVVFAAFLIPCLSIDFEDDQKNYYSPDPHAGTPPHTGHRGRAPPHGGGSQGNPPSHGGYNPTPSTPSNCGNPPHPSTPSNPPSGYHPPTSVSPPTYVSPPISIDPGTPTYPGVPTPPFYPGPNPPTTGTCNYWSTHPGVIWSVLGWWGTLGNAFGVSSLPGIGANMSLQQALSNTRTDGFGALYREGTAAWLNSMVNHRFPFTTTQVRQNFVSALHSNTAAAAQARLFKLANEGHLKPRP